MITVDLSGAERFFSASGPDYSAAARAHETLTGGTGPGAEFTGWLTLPERMRRGELRAVTDAAARIRSRSRTLVVVGIGGSYLGAKGAVELLRPSPRPGDTRVLFCGNGLSPDYLNDLIESLGDDDFDVNVISKSGTTLEPALGFRIMRGLLRRKYGAGADGHIFATTDAARGALHDMAAEFGWQSFTVPDDVGGRYSVLSAVGLLPMAAAGIDVGAVVNSAADAMSEMDRRDEANPVWRYAAARRDLYRQGFGTELLACYEPSFRFMAEWWKQLYGESEGKDGVGIFPASVEYTADLHSMGQYIQSGPRNMQETVVSFASDLSERLIPPEEGDPDGLNYLSGRSMSQVWRVARQAVMAAHAEGGVPNIAVEAPRRDESGLAQLICFFELACGVSGYMSGVNPFDQPGVEAYKRNMFRMLGKPGAK